VVAWGRTEHHNKSGRARDEQSKDVGTGHSREQMARRIVAQHLADTPRQCSHQDRQHAHGEQRHIQLAKRLQHAGRIAIIESEDQTGYHADNNRHGVADNLDQCLQQPSGPWVGNSAKVYLILGKLLSTP